VWHRSFLKKILLLAVLLSVVLVPASLLLAERRIPSDTLDGDASAILEATRFTSNQYTQTDDETVVDSSLTIPGTFSLVGETDALQLFAESPNGAIRVVNKEDGYVYGSSFDAANVPIPYFNTTWEGIVNSAAVIEYYSYNDTNGAYIVNEESFYTSPLTTMDYRTIDDGYELAVFYGESSIGLTIRVYVEGIYLHVEVPAESITEGDAFKLRSVKCFPFLGSVFGDSIPGYVFVPDGSGALIRYKPIDAVTEIYEFNYYGSDTGILRTGVDEAMLNFPVYGMIHGVRQHGFVQIIENGDAFATLVVSPAKNNLKYYYSYNKFVYRNTYRSPSSKADAASGAGQQVIEAGRNSCDVAVVYAFLAGDDADYVGMANGYQDYLVGQNADFGRAPAVGVVPALIELIGAEPSPGFLFDEMRVMTSYAGAGRILSELATTIPALTVVYKGWSDGGYSAGGVDYDRREAALGTQAELLELIETYNQGPNALLLFTDFLRVSDAGSYSVYRDVSQRIDTSLHTAFGIERTWYYLSPTRSVMYLDRAVDTLLGWGATELALGSIGYLLYSDYRDTADAVDRAEAIALYRTALADGSMDFSVYRANAYLLAYANRYLSVPTTSSGYAIYTDTVPFAAILLAGVMEAYGPYANFFANRTEETLRSIDYGLLPSFILTEASAYLLNDTELASLYSSSYDTWREAVGDIYGSVASALSTFYGSRVVSRRVPAPGIVMTSYDNGVTVYVNYTGSDYLAGLLTIPAQSFEAVIPDA